MGQMQAQTKTCSDTQPKVSRRKVRPDTSPHVLIPGTDWGQGVGGSKVSWELSQALSSAFPGHPPATSALCPVHRNSHALRARAQADPSQQLGWPTSYALIPKGPLLQFGLAAPFTSPPSRGQPFPLLASQCPGQTFVYISSGHTAAGTQLSPRGTRTQISAGDTVFGCPWVGHSQSLIAFGKVGETIQLIFQN